MNLLILVVKVLAVDPSLEMKPVEPHGAEPFVRTLRPEAIKKTETSKGEKLNAGIFVIGYAPMFTLSLIVGGGLIASGILGGSANNVIFGLGVGLLEATPLLGPIVTGALLMNSQLGRELAAAFFVMAGLQALGLAVMAISHLSPKMSAEVMTVSDAKGAPWLKVKVAAGASGANVSLLFSRSSRLGYAMPSSRLSVFTSSKYCCRENC